MSYSLHGTPDDRELIGWQQGMLLAKAVDRLTSKIPGEEKYGLASQMRRAAVPIPSNLADGQARQTAGECVPFISPAGGSPAELDTQLPLSIDRGSCSHAEAAEAVNLIHGLRKMLNALRRSISSYNP